MGKWSPNYVDDVLHSKISSLVSGAIRRASVEKDSTASLTYENFVHELDSGDSFTTSIIDILVKEVADRRVRTTANDRKLLSERTIRSLKHLASSSRTYSNRPQGRSHGRRAHLTDYFTAANDLEMDDDDDFGDPVAENATTIEGARVNSDLYDAFSSTSWPAVTRRITASPSPVSDDWPSLQPTRSPTTTTSNRPWSTSATNANSNSNAPSNLTSNLSRQASIRRAVRSRMVDFNDFTHRRRSATRETGAPRPESGGAESVTEPRDASSSQTVRRFFPFPRPSRRPQSSSTNMDQAWTDLVEPPSPDSSDDPVYHFSVEPTWYDGIADPRFSPDEESREDAELMLRAPRLRRGGVRAPESMLSRHASPITITTPPGESAAVIPPSLVRRDSTSSLPMPGLEEPVAYPTPGSVDNENIV